ncbi:hypothetical protein BKA62DRAFT_717704 [Auriculariales sp. MPI-PUGE-AT-0066]|nr:hypothetical protein BKA62DRAFT_717704 [Auriculariales sp. MPI-PUGE-AT-0066]
MRPPWLAATICTLAVVSGPAMAKLPRLSRTCFRVADGSFTPETDVALVEFDSVRCRSAPVKDCESEIESELRLE